jgi:hypothetical protein
MAQRAKWVAIAALAIGALLFMLALYGRLGVGSELLSVVGVVLVLGGAGTLLGIHWPPALKLPHVAVSAVVAVAALLHAFECFADGATDAGMAFFVWGMTPYVLCLIISSLGTLRVAPAVGGALALAIDVLVHFEVFVSPQASTAAMLLVFVPLWNNLVLVPAGTIVAWLFARRRSQSA